MLVFHRDKLGVKVGEKVNGWKGGGGSLVQVVLKARKVEKLA
jgi:hypothetical protein